MRLSRSLWSKKLLLAMARVWVTAARAKVASQASGVVAAKVSVPQRRGWARALLISFSSFWPSVCQSPKRADNSGRASTMRHSRSRRLTPMSTNCGSSTTWQKLSWTAFMADCASRGPDRLMACTLTIG
ncbi:hypothetical protein D3C84_887370 [compost metagenome]